MPATMLWDKSNIDTASLTTLESTVKDIGLDEIKIGRGNSKSEIVYLELDGTDTKFGIYYTDSETRQSYLKRIKKGDKVKLTYNKLGHETDEGFNLHIYQLGHNGELLIKSGDSQKRDNNFSKIMFGLGTAFLIWPFLLYRHIRKQNSKLSRV
jgi:hypothetical protein